MSKASAAFPATRMLSQALSNIVTGNDALAQSLWTTYVNLPEEQLILTEDEVVTAHQTTLLKLVDSYLHASQQAHEVALSGRYAADRGRSFFDVLTDAFFALSTYAQDAIQRALGSGGHTSPPREAHSNPPSSTEEEQSDAAPPPLQNLDLLLPKVCEALVLVTQCLTTVALRAEEAAATAARPGGTQPMHLSPKDLLVAAASERSGPRLVESLIETLRLVDVFVPRITYGKVAKRPVVPDGADILGQGREAAPGNSKDGGGAGLAGPSPEDASAAQAFALVRRDLVRLLGILAAENRSVQERVRECGGIPVVMNLCVVDDYNPYLREHAIFALRNLLHANAENQAVVDAIKPVGKWDEEKVLRDIRGGGP
ncbi:Ataxin-10 -like protein [Trametes pubescens]|uniref:Ataxin-10 homolog n=1 Tax=Trametes pubescens TaxID=154538 RepID=A0A1M2VPX1_TRAPU|nr:Ataxin-10 -like protein [Trametes pubescens]